MLTENDFIDLYGDGIAVPLEISIVFLRKEHNFFWVYSDDHNYEIWRNIRCDFDTLLNYLTIHGNKFTKCDICTNAIGSKLIDADKLLATIMNMCPRITSLSIKGLRISTMPTFENIRILKLEEVPMTSIPKFPMLVSLELVKMKVLVLPFLPFLSELVLIGIEHDNVVPRWNELKTVSTNNVELLLEITNVNNGIVNIWCGGNIRADEVYKIVSHQPNLLFMGFCVPSSFDLKLNSTKLPGWEIYRDYIRKCKTN